MAVVKDILYLLSVSLFIFGLKKLGSPKTARAGNSLAMLGMLIAIVVTLFDRQILDLKFIIVGLAIGSLIGAVAARKVAMTAMPQMVALFNSMGGGASALVALAQFLRMGQEINPGAGAAAGTANGTVIFLLVTISISIFIGTLTFTGSVVAYAKLQGIMRGAPIVFKGQRWFNLLLLVIPVVAAVLLVMGNSPLLLMLLILFLSGLLGVTAIIPIGGADMPVVISLLNSLSGVAAAATGFVLSSPMLIISGSLVGASGIILTNIMCRAMNRSLGNVLLAAVGSGAAAAAAAPGAAGEKKQVTGYSTEDAAMMLEAAQSLIVVPGYGLAVAQAQHVVHELANLLEAGGCRVRYAIHPVAGRMPGHMNVLLAEADVPYDQLVEMDIINDDFPQTDVVLVVGANDVINPAARSKKESPLYGMPILNVDQAKTVIVIKRSLSPGFAGEDNELFYDAKTMMVFGDAKKILTELVQYMKNR